VTPSKGVEEGGLIEVSEEDIQALSDKVVKQEDEFDVMAEILPIPIHLVWDNFLADKAKYSFVQFMEDAKEKDVVLDPWTPMDQDEGKKEEVESEKSTNPADGVAPTPINLSDVRTQEENMKRQMRLKVNIKGVPF
jgi:hypothetical protein